MLTEQEVNEIESKVSKILNEIKKPNEILFIKHAKFNLHEEGKSSQRTFTRNDAEGFFNEEFYEVAMNHGYGYIVYMDETLTVKLKLQKESGFEIHLWEIYLYDRDKMNVTTENKIPVIFKKAV